MLFTELTKLDRSDLEKLLAQSLSDRGIDTALLTQTLGETVSIRDLMIGVIEDALREAADANRESFRARQRKGIQDAIDRGTPIGRPSRKDEKKFAEVLALYEDRQMTGDQAAKRLHVARGTFYRWVKEAHDAAAEEKAAQIQPEHLVKDQEGRPAE